MSRWRSSMALLAIAMVATVIGFLRVITEPTPLPLGSSYSAQPDGARAFYAWLADLGAQPQRFTDVASIPSSGSIVIVQPLTAIDTHLLDDVADAGGTIVLAGDSLPWLLSARNLGVRVTPTQPSQGPSHSPDGLALPVPTRYRVQADTAQPLLVLPNGDWLALRMPYHQGTLVVLASPEPLTNAGLSDPDTARFVYREVVSPMLSTGQTVAFDEIDRPGEGAAGASATPSVDELLFATAPGRAVVYAAVLVFVFLLLTGRRLGPAVVPRSAAQSQRTMYEHVQMLADLYRRGGQFVVLRDSLARHYAPHHPTAAAQVAAAKTEHDLLAALPDDR